MSYYNVPVQSKTDDLNYIIEHVGIDTQKTSVKEALILLEKDNTPTTSWIVDALTAQYGDDFGDIYRKAINNKICQHGFLKSCSYCKWGIE
jgi:hypothetical protein